MKTKKKVIVIGAGLSGLTAAYYLLKAKKNFDVTILEAADRIGGRVKTANVNGHKIDSGGFMIFEWYKHFLKLTKELGLSDHIIPYPMKEYFYFNDKLTSSENLPVCFLEKTKLILRTLPHKLVGRLNFYEPDLKLYRNTKASEFISPKTDLYKIYDTLATGYTYPSFDDIPLCLSLSLAWKLQTGGMFKNISRFLGGTEILIRDLAQEVSNYGGKIMVNQKVQRCVKNKIKTNQKIFDADVVIFASTLDHRLFENIFNKKINFYYTKHFSLVAEYRKKVCIDRKSDWTMIYRPKGDQDLEIVTLANIPQMAHCLDGHFVGINICAKTGVEKFNKNDLLKAVSEQTKKLFKGNNVIKIHYAEKWTRTMPDLSVDSLEMIREKEGVGGHYFIGDYLSMPSMETAVYNGKKVANSIIEKFS